MASYDVDWTELSALFNGKFQLTNGSQGWQEAVDYILSGTPQQILATCMSGATPLYVSALGVTWDKTTKTFVKKTGLAKTSDKVCSLLPRLTTAEVEAAKEKHISNPKYEKWRQPKIEGKLADMANWTYVNQKRCKMVLFIVIAAFENNKFLSTGKFTESFSKLVSGNEKLNNSFNKPMIDVIAKKFKTEATLVNKLNAHLSTVVAAYNGSAIAKT